MCTVNTLTYGKYESAIYGFVVTITHLHEDFIKFSFLVHSEWEKDS